MLHPPQYFLTALRTFIPRSPPTTLTPCATLGAACETHPQLGPWAWVLGWTVGRVEREEKWRKVDGLDGRDGRGGQVTGEEEQRAQRQEEGWLREVMDEIDRIEVEVEALGARAERRREARESI